MCPNACQCAPMCAKIYYTYCTYHTTAVPSHFIPFTSRLDLVSTCLGLTRTWCGCAHKHTIAQTTQPTLLHINCLRTEDQTSKQGQNREISRHVECKERICVIRYTGCMGYMGYSVLHLHLLFLHTAREYSVHTTAQPSIYPSPLDSSRLSLTR